MADILKISAPITHKDYAMTPNHIAQGDKVFNLVDLNKVVKTSDRNEQFSQTEDSFDTNVKLPSSGISVSKETGAAVKLLNFLISSDTISKLYESGNTEFLQKLTEFTDSLFLSPEKVLTDLISQQNEATAFSGEIFNLLRTVLENSGSKDLKNSIISFLKASVTTTSQAEVLNSISNSLRYLADYFSPSKSLSEQLNALANKYNNFNMADFPALKGETFSVLGEVSNSLLVNDNIKGLISLITYNLSKINGNTNLLTDSFNDILNQINNADIQKLLVNAFNKYLNNLPSDNFSQLNINYNSSSLSSSLKLMGNETIADLEGVLRTFLSEGEVRLFLSEFSQNNNLNNLIDKLSNLLNRFENFDDKLLVAEKMNNILTSMIKSGEYGYKAPTSMDNLVDFIFKNINDPVMQSTASFNSNSLVQNLLSAPGVFTPLLHFLIPIENEDMKAFGELWVDNSEGSENEESSSKRHLYLNFQIEDVGRFELEILTVNRDINIGLFCPKEFIPHFQKIKSSISKIASSKGFNARTTNVLELSHVRSLTEVFPNLKEKRSGLNVKI